MLAGSAFAATTSQSNAVRKAQSYLSFMAFSRSGLIDQLEFEGFSTSDATYAVDHVGADWRDQAVKKAQSYLSFMSFSNDGLIKQLEFEGFTHEEALWGVQHCGSSGGGVDQKSQAVEKAKSYLRYSSFSRSGLIKQLEFEGFSNADATYAVDHITVDWNEQAKKKAESYISWMSFSRSSLLSQLKYEGFTQSQAEYGVKAVGY